jgi:predicted phosphodiesterase
LEEARELRDTFLESRGYRLQGTQLVEIDGAPDDEPYIKKEERGNTLIIEVRVEGIHTLESALDYCQVDLDIWRVDHWRWNKWPVGAKAEKKNLSFDEGKISGTIESDGLTIAPLIQVTIWFVRKKPIPLYPTLQPIQCTPVEYHAKIENHSTIKRALVFGDSQIGFMRDLRSAKLEPIHDRRAMDLCVQIAAMQQPAVIVHLGDLLDMTEWTDRFIRMPEFTECTQPAILEAFHWFSRLRSAAPNARIVVIEGNHDKRMRTGIVTHLRAAYGLKAADELEMPPAMSLPRLLALDSLGIEWKGDYPAGDVWLGDQIRCIHGDVAQQPGGTSKTIAWNSDHTTVYGHIHRREWVERNKIGQHALNEVAAFSPGCLCHIDGRVPGHRRENSWQQGAAIVEYGEDIFNIAPVRFGDGRCVYDNRLFEGRDNADVLKQRFLAWNW